MQGEVRGQQVIVDVWNGGLKDTEELGLEDARSGAKWDGFSKSVLVVPDISEIDRPMLRCFPRKEGARDRSPSKSRTHIEIWGMLT